VSTWYERWQILLCQEQCLRRVDYCCGATYGWEQDDLAGRDPTILDVLHHRITRDECYISDNHQPWSSVSVLK